MYYICNVSIKVVKLFFQLEDLFPDGTNLQLPALMKNTCTQLTPVGGFTVGIITQAIASGIQQLKYFNNDQFN